jgi:hypothetical protein
LIYKFGCGRTLESAPIEATVAQSLRAQEIVVIQIAPAQLDPTITESIVAFGVSIAKSINATLPNHIADNGPSCRAWTATVPTTIARVVTINKPIELFLLPAIPAPSLREARGRDRGE